MNSLTPAQKTAYDLLLAFLQGAHDAHLAVLEGYAGTGKTFLVARLLGALPGLKIAVAAPTNKAVRVLRDKLIDAGVAVAAAGDDEDAWKALAVRPADGCTCRSIHSLLGLKLKELENGQQEAVKERNATLRDYDVVVIDECSMLNAFLFEKTVMERGRAQVLFVGDPAQLPPVSKQGVALSPVFDRVDLKVRLTEVVRQARENPIIALSIRLRQLIEANVKASVLALLEVLPPIASGPKAVLASGPPQTLVDWYLSQHAGEPDSDIRIIAYTNDRVQQYNALLHRALYGATATRFVAGERVIVHSQCAAQRRLGESAIKKTDRLITSDELTVIDAECKRHPLYSGIDAEWLLLQGHDGERYEIYVAADEELLNQKISACFAEFHSLKAQAAQASRPQDQYAIQRAASDASSRGWALKNAFASVRHAYAITCHKSQGSTFDCALVDFTDLSKISDALLFNRALYVAVTRSREFMAMIVT